ncbi:site-2 protease family protein [Oculatella sp. FACHB-28]|uniref:site-2 protease family protein n=1 Tax=Cyanophyceae TaxID=3028117 RepID=UPI0016868CD8|nr:MULTISPECIES: site-2 protease family protein [Cyanophyceae]MBD1871171.1 site-2 protease family protein [Cyanobacteria bacterium FACHB-471]MBD2055997.1 site-2 protease family protein [Oculatella sp. FACHB-28]MBD2069300.1 site-2 protease family protein [Leptolyngbya sp. FACHB-671]
MNGNLRVGNLFGIPFYVNPSWFLVLGLVTWSYGSGLVAQFPELGVTAWGLGLVTALLLFASVLAHELGHSFVAMAQGIEVKSITLFIFGGLASLGEESKTPEGSFKVAIAGPLVSFVLFGLFTAVNLLLDLPNALTAIVALLSYINLALGVFNLIPGLPLDGGNVLKAIVWKITGKPYKGVAFASRVGQFFGWVGVALGILSVLGLSSVGSIWTLLIGWFLLQNAGRSAQSATVQEKLSGLTAGDAVDPDSPIVSASSSLREFANGYIIGNEKNWQKFLVTDENGQLVGEISVDSMKTIPTNDWWDVQVKELMQPIDQVNTVPSDKPLLEVIGLLEEKKLPALVVIRDNGVLVGLLEKASIVQLLQKKAEAEAA